MNNYKYLKIVKANYQDRSFYCTYLSKNLYIHKYIEITSVCIYIYISQLFQGKVHIAIFEKKIFQFMLSSSHHSITI